MLLSRNDFISEAIVKNEVKVDKPIQDIQSWF